MNNLEPTKVMRCLAEGVDPISLNPLTEDSPLQQPYLIRTFYAAAAALQIVKEREAKKSNLPKNAGRGWSALEDEELCESFSKGTTLKLMASEHERTVAAVRARLVKLGKISEFEEIQ